MASLWLCWVIVLILHYLLSYIVFPSLFTDEEKMCVKHDKMFLIDGLETKTLIYGVNVILFYVNFGCFAVFAIISKVFFNL